MASNINNLNCSVSHIIYKPNKFGNVHINSKFYQNETSSVMYFVSILLYFLLDGPRWQIHSAFFSYEVIGIF